MSRQPIEGPEHLVAWYLAQGDLGSALEGVLHTSPVFFCTGPWTQNRHLRSSASYRLSNHPIRIKCCFKYGKHQNNGQNMWPVNLNIKLNLRACVPPRMCVCKCTRFINYPLSVKGSDIRSWRSITKHNASNPLPRTHTYTETNTNAENSINQSVVCSVAKSCFSTNAFLSQSAGKRLHQPHHEGILRDEN